MENDIFDKFTALIDSIELNDAQRQQLLNGALDIALNSIEQNKSLRYEFTFDLRVRSLELYYPNKSITNAWGDVGDYLVANGFEKKSDSDYISNSLSLAKLSKTIDGLKEKYPWFEICAKKVMTSVMHFESDIYAKWEMERSIEKDNIIKNTLIFNKQNKELALPSGFVITAKSEDSLVSGKLLVEPKKQIDGCNLKYIFNMDKKEATLVINEKPMGIKPLNKDTVSRIKDVYEKAKQPQKAVENIKTGKKIQPRDNDLER